MIFVTSDTHFFDEHLLGITDFAVRPFLLASMMKRSSKIGIKWSLQMIPSII